MLSLAVFKKEAYMKCLIDIHTHGIGRYDTRTAHPENILKIACLHGKAGTGAILPTIYSAPIDEMRKNMEAVRQAITAGIRDSGLGVSKKTNPQPPTPNPYACILGVHLEGPFLNPARCGAQDKKSFIKPTISNLKKLIEGYEDMAKIITIAPELPRALEVIEKSVSLGIKVNMGHSDATYKQALDGKKAGATGITHLFNAMRPFHHREPGLAGFGLLDEDIYIEVIADRIHINDEVLKFIFKIKRPDRIILISDSVKGNKDKKGRIYSKPGVLAGSSITLAEAVGNIKKIGIPERAVLKTVIDNPMKYLSCAELQ